jgi:hypothetical protein
MSKRHKDSRPEALEQGLATTWTVPDRDNRINPTRLPRIMPSHLKNFRIRASFGRTKDTA